jgi:hypothetical protein
MTDQGVNHFLEAVYDGGDGVWSLDSPAVFATAFSDPATLRSFAVNLLNALSHLDGVNRAHRQAGFASTDNPGVTVASGSMIRVFWGAA